VKQRNNTLSHILKAYEVFIWWF